MLILTRRVGERIMIGDNMSITVLRINGSQVRLGIDAPRSISVQREELLQPVKEEAAQTAIRIGDDAPAGTPPACKALAH